MRLRLLHLRCFPWIAIATALWASPAVSNSAPRNSGWIRLKPGLEYREVARAGDVVHQLRCDPQLTRLGLITSQSFGKPAATVAELSDSVRCWAAVNGGYFGQRNEALGYQRDRDRVVCPDIATGSAFGGVFVVGPQGPDLLAREDFRPGKAFPFAIQCGPRLINQRSKIAGIRSERAARRTGIGYDGSGRVVLFASGVGARLTFAECQEMLIGPAQRGGLDALGVLNLDGGSSTALSLRVDKLKRDIVGFAPVPVAVGVFPR